MIIQETPSFTLTGHSSWIHQVLFLPDGRLASCSWDTTIKIWDADNGKELFELKGHTDWVYSIAILPSGHLVSGSGDGTIKIWDLEKKKDVRTIKGHSDWVVCLRVLKNGNLVSFSKDDTIKIWDLNTGEDKSASKIKGHGNTASWLPLFGVLSNGYLVTCSRDSSAEKECILQVWNPNVPNPFKSISTGLNDVCSLLILSNDQVALGCEKSGTIKIVSLDSGTSLKVKERAHDGAVWSLAQLQNGNLVSAAVDGSNRTIKVWSSLDWSLLQTVNSGHSNEIRSLSNSERFLASGSEDRTIKLWPITIQ